jgi:energy-coupling factor transporter ATP-binding protein EcfA2
MKRVKMRLDSIELEWFRGAADLVSLPLTAKSVVVYGPNGAGKSSFVDAIEYFLCKGKIGHLTHEYSGKKQEKGVINTHKPTLSPTRAAVVFADGSRATVDVKSNGTFSTTGKGLGHLAGLDYRRVVLRQDEVAAFISSPKGEKYSALLPLLGLEELECAAENIRQLAKRVTKLSDLEGKQRELSIQRKAAQGAFSSVDAFGEVIQTLHLKYRSSAPRESTLAADCLVLKECIRTRVAELTPDAQRHASLRNLADIPVEASLQDVQIVEAELIASSIKLLTERVAVLDNAAVLVAAEDEERVRCPACGSDIDRVDLSAHLASERERMMSDRALLDQHNLAVEILANAIAAAKAAATNALTAAWWTSQHPDGGPEDIAWLKKLQPAAVRAPSAGAAREAVRNRLLPIMHAARLEAASPPPGTEELLTDSEAIQAADAALATANLEIQVSRLTAVTTHLETVESRLRMEIRERSDAVIADISADIQRMWGILHPNHEIEDVRLHHPDETDKAIDIELKFFGIELKSPRLTLSEGNRNSLGLCVFLAMARRADTHVPVILDDVVVSLDRDHRGMVVTLLEKEFADRQVVIFTHDRDWYGELRHMVDEGAWSFHVLRPYVSPAQGISWSSRAATLDDARSYLDTAPDTAANVARKIMDTELSFLAEKLQLRMEYRRELRNDHRMAHDFLVALIAASRRALQKKGADGKYNVHADAIVLCEATDRLLMTWGNKGSHTFDLVKEEATQLIDHCERTLAIFACEQCAKAVHRLDDNSGMKQCGCGTMRWRYDKA